jgi:hypothetical protein
MKYGVFGALCVVQPKGCSLGCKLEVLRKTLVSKHTQNADLINPTKNNQIKKFF